MRKVLLIIVFSLLVCGVAIAADITGTWKGYLKANGEYAKVTAEIEQYEDGTFVGTWKTSLGGRGSLGGKLKGRSLTIKLKNKVCSGSYSGKGRLSYGETQIKYNVSGSDCNGDLSGGGKLYYKE